MGSPRRSPIAARGWHADELVELNGIIAVQSRELAELVEDLLVASRAEAGNLSIKPDLIDLRAEVESVVRGVRESHPSHKDLIVDGENVKAWADALRCRQIIRNLLTNAVKYGGDRIAVLVRMVGDRAQILVVDDGQRSPVRGAGAHLRAGTTGAVSHRPSPGRSGSASPSLVSSPS